MRLFIATCLFCVLFIKLGFVNAELADPRNRDEDLSNTELNVEVTQEKGLYKYVYTVINPTENLGTINNLMIDLSCDLEFPDADIPVNDERPGYIGDLSPDGTHVPVEVFAGYGTSNTYGVTKNNYALWGVYLPPGNQVTNIYILSPAPPGERTYIIEPYMDNSEPWDYSTVSEDDPTIPWIDDFTVSGNVIGPACSLDKPGYERYQGTGEEPFNINGLLSYVTPEHDPVNITSEHETVKFHIYYSESIQKKSFSAKLNGIDIRNRFNPVPGTNEIVELSGPWKEMNRIILSVKGLTDGRVKGRSQESRPDQSWSTPAKERSAIKFDEFKSKDVDKFHVWLRD